MTLNIEFDDCSQKSGFSDSSLTPARCWSIHIHLCRTFIPFNQNAYNQNRYKNYNMLYSVNNNATSI